MNNQPVTQASPAEVHLPSCLATAAQADPVVTEILAQVNAQEPVVQRACEMWLEERRRELAHEPLGTLVHTFHSPEVHQRAVELFMADIAEHAAILRQRLAHQRRQQALMHLHASLAEHDVFFQNDGDEVYPNRMEVRRVTKSQQLDCIKRVVQFAKDIAEDKAGLSPEAMVNGVLPDSLKGCPVTDFTVELGEYLIKSGELGKEIIQRICDDPSCAAMVEADPQCPRPLRHLANLTIALKNAAAYKPSNSTATVGFAAA